MKTKLIDLLGLTNMANDIRDWVNAKFQRKVDGKGLSENDYDDTAKAKVDAIPADPKYTDTVYDDTALSGRVSTIEGKESGWDGKQDALVSGMNIKTVNGESLLGGGNIEIQGGGGGEENVIEAITMNGASVPVTNKRAAITETDPTVPSWAKQPNKPSYNYSEIGNTPDLSGFITKSVNDLANYYLKSETYTKSEVSALIAAIQQFHYEIYASLPQSGESNVLYLIGPTGTGKDKYEEYVYANGDFVPIGDTSIDLSGYVTTSALNTALASYATTQDLDDSKVFWAEMDVTTFAEIKDAIDAGRTVMLKDEDCYVYRPSYIYDDIIIFSLIESSERYIRSYVIYNDDSWEAISGGTLELQNNKVNSISSSSDYYHYPSAKAVYDIVSTKYTKPQGGIPASDLASGVIPTVPVQDVTVGGTSVVSGGTAVIPAIPDVSGKENTSNKVTSFQATPDDTHYPSEKLVKDSIDAVDKVFWAIYGTTTAAEIDAAVVAGKVVMCARNDYIYILHVSNSSAYYFMATYASGIAYLYLNKTTNAWVASGFSPENKTDKVSTITGNETNTTKYPNTKAVADALGKWGVVSQTQTWSGTDAQPRTYVMSDLVYGTIPQANIDLFESAGATFNATSGYFELNGLTDISYEEMQKIYSCSIAASTLTNTRSMAFATPSANFKIRCTLPLKKMTSFTTNFSYLCFGADVIEQVNIEATYLSGTSVLISAFQNAYCLKKIGDGYMNYIGGASDSAFKNCYSLETVYLKGLKANMKFIESPNLSMESIAYMVANAGTDNITITLHPTAYKAAIVNTDVTAALQTKTNVSLASA